MEQQRGTSLGSGEIRECGIQAFPVSGNSVGSSAGRARSGAGKGKGCRALGFSWRSLCTTRGVHPNSPGTTTDASVNLLQTSFTECFRDKL